MNDEGVYGDTRVVSCMHHGMRRHNWAMEEIEVGDLIEYFVIVTRGGS